MKAHSEEIYGKSTLSLMLKSTFSGLGHTMSQTTRVYLHSY